MTTAFTMGEERGVWDGSPSEAPPTKHKTPMVEWVLRTGVPDLSMCVMACRWGSLPENHDAEVNKEDQDRAVWKVAEERACAKALGHDFTACPNFTGCVF